MAEPPTDCTEDQDQETANPEKSVLQSKKLQKLRKAYETKGIIYVSRIPPHMVVSISQPRRCFMLCRVGTLSSVDCRNRISCASCWSSLGLLAGSIVHLKVGSVCSKLTNIQESALLPDARPDGAYLKLFELQTLLCVSRESRRAAIQARTLQKAGLNLKIKQWQSRLPLC